MHYLHQLLVNLPDIGISNPSTADEDTREEMAREARQHAEECTESYYNQIFDWRITETAGGWSEEYPENVIFSADSAELFIRELEAIRQDQTDMVENLLKTVKSELGEGDLLGKIHAVWECDGYFSSALRQLGEILSGEYTIDSGFYNCCEWSPILRKSDINLVKETPCDWALVMFDYHL